MKSKNCLKVIAMFFSLSLILGFVSLATFAIEYTEDESHYLKIVTKRDWELAPGIVESEIVLSKEDGSYRQVCHVIEIDTDNPYTKIIPSAYKMAEGLSNKEYKTQIMSEQAKYAEEHGYGNVVAAMNTCLHWYDTDYYVQHPELIGETLGTMILDGVRYTNSQNTFFGAYTCIVINYDEKDRQTRPDNIPKVEVRQTYDAITGWEEQLIPASFHFLVKDGVNQHTINDPEPAAPRSMMGIKADGTIILAMVEGRQEPYSAGFNAYEMAKFMLSLGCVQAINCDGGGSSTFLSQRPNEELELHCSPSDGSERPVTHGVLVISTVTDFHEHEPGEKTDKEPTSTESGYIGRIFCTTCGYVINAGIEIPPNNHTYSIDILNKKIICDCGCTFNKSGLQMVDGKIYYIVNGNLKNGWISLYDEWYYFDANTFAGNDGEQYADKGVKFLFENGRLVKGVWVVTSDGSRYWYGPGYYKDNSTELTSSRPYEIDGKTYLFNRQGYMQTGIARFYDATGSYVYYNCGTDGVAVLYTGLYDDYYYLDGIRQRAYQLVLNTDGNFYFINDGNKIAKNMRIYLGEKFVSGKTLPDGRTLIPGYYTFDADGKMVIEPMKNGVVGDYLYINDVKQTRYKLVEYEGSFYFINDGDKIAKNVRLYLSSNYVNGKVLPDGRAIQPGYYNFSADGKMILEALKNGLIGDYLYINDIKQIRYKLVEYDGNFYFINDGDKVVKNTRLYLSSNFVEGKVLPDGRALIPGYYNFAADGKMIIESLKNGVVGDYLYINDVKQTRYKLVEYSGSFYFINDGDKVVKSTRLYLSSTFVNGKVLPDGRELLPGYYNFAADGKMIIESLKNGVVGDYLYINDVKQTRYKLVEYDGNLYFINDGDKVAKNTRLYLSETFVKGKILPDGREMLPGYYNFAADGKLIVESLKNGIVGDYLYINDVKQTRYKLVEYDGNYYFINDGDKIAKNTRLYLSDRFVANTPIPSGYYNFDANGKLIIS